MITHVCDLCSKVVDKYGTPEMRAYTFRHEGRIFSAEVRLRPVLINEHVPVALCDDCFWAVFAEAVIALKKELKK